VPSNDDPTPAGALERQIDFADGLVLVPNDRAGSGAVHGGRFSWRSASAGWQTAFRELAALLAAGWTPQPIACLPGRSDAEEQRL
jgi:hypothetical protein